MRFANGYNAVTVRFVIIVTRSGGNTARYARSPDLCLSFLVKVAPPRHERAKNVTGDARSYRGGPPLGGQT